MNCLQICRWTVFNSVGELSSISVGELSSKCVSVNCLVGELSRFRLNHIKFDQLLSNRSIYSWMIEQPPYNKQEGPKDSHGCVLGQTWFSCSLYSFHSEQAEQKSSPLEHLCWRTPEYSVFQGGADRTVTWPVPKKMADHYLHAQKYFVSLDLFWSTPKCPVLLVYVAVLAYAEYSKNC